MLAWPVQLQVHEKDGVIHMCHTTCALLDAGPLEAFFNKTATWLASHPDEVVTVLMGNADKLGPAAFRDPLRASGLAPWVYVPPVAAMTLDDWPTLEELIRQGTRVVIMLDYGANFTEEPWLLDEFAVMWETPFSPTDATFPCTPQRPPDVPRAQRVDRLYTMNHNLNRNWSIGDVELLVPDLLQIDQTNAAQGPGSVGASVNGCVATWGRPPNFVLVDFYERGDFRLSTLSVAARANGLMAGQSVADTHGSLNPLVLAVLFVLFMLALLAGGILYCCRQYRRSRRTQKEKAHDTGQPLPTT